MNRSHRKYQRYCGITAAALAALLIGASCTMMGQPVFVQSGHYYIDPAADFAGIGRVVVFELGNESPHVDIGPYLTDAVTQAFGKRHLFTLRSIGPGDPDWHNMQMAGNHVYSIEEVAVMREKLAADAVVCGSILHYQPYPNLLTGLHIRIIDLRSGKTVWAMEQVWDSSDKTVELRMKRYFTEMRNGYEPLNWQVFLISPRAFDKFVADEIARTLPGPPPYVRINGERAAAAEAKQ